MINCNVEVWELSSCDSCFETLLHTGRVSKYSHYPYHSGLAAERVQQMTKIASLRTVVLGAPLRDILKHLGNRTVAPDADNLVALMHRPRQSYFLIPQVYIPASCICNVEVWVTQSPKYLVVFVAHIVVVIWPIDHSIYCVSDYKSPFSLVWTLGMYFGSQRRLLLYFLCVIKTAMMLSLPHHFYRWVSYSWLERTGRVQVFKILEKKH